MPSHLGNPEIFFAKTSREKAGWSERLEMTA